LGQRHRHEGSLLSMAGIDESEVIDRVAEQADGSVLLVIVKEGAWDVPNDVPKLKAKMNTYAQFALDGGLVASYPHLEGRPITIRVVSFAAIPGVVQDVIDVAIEQLRGYRIAVTTEVKIAI